MNNEYVKPVSMSVTEFFIKRTAIKTLTSESIVDAVIKHQWKSANEATKKNNEVEISGIGKFYVSSNKTRKRIAKLELVRMGYEKIIRETADERKKNITINKLKVVTDKLDYLKDKLNKNEY